MDRLFIAELNISEIIDRLSAKYRVSKRDLWEDWQKRTQWVYDVFDLEPAGGAATDMMRLSHDDVRSAEVSRRRLTESKPRSD